ncbi:S41 family peptidase [Oceanihabitans sp. 2_MG-2023]|uniref:S41 family peptidase n=1 Tax=Oceanihabitans sp. 2_MG-2023 TaxID=3062661 RepID=UPI0026E31A16|nr:S41 family peptidase [Oceanihabitans sp. 2_MG-2023]MDO6596883.1 S41 family peptidase [Oceanihabitans sp. 2_MG-2023]
MKYFLLIIVFLSCSLHTEAQTTKYFKHLVFRETPFSKTEGRIPLTEREVQNVNHYKLHYDSLNSLTLVEYKYNQSLIELNRSGILDGKRALAPKTQIRYTENTETRLFFDVNNKPTTNGMGVFKEVYSYNKKGKRVGLKFYDKNDKPINNSWNIFEYTWKHINNNSVLETRKDEKGVPVTMRPYYKFYNVLYKFNDKGLLLSMNNVDNKLKLINDETGIATDKATYDKNKNFINFKFINAENEPVVGSFLGTAGGFATYDKNGNCLKYGTVGLDGNYKISKRSNDAYSKYKFDSIGNLIERSNYDIDNKIQIRNGVISVRYIYNKDNPVQHLKTELHHTKPNKKVEDSILKNFNTQIGKDKLVEDLNQLLETLKEHPSQFEFIGKDSYEKLVNSQRDKLKDSMSVTEFYQITSPIVASLGCLHTRIVDTRFFRTPQKYWLPLIVWFDNEKMYAVNNCVENIEMNTGSEILEINGIPSSEIFKTLKSTISADAYNQSFYRGDLNVNFLYYYHSYFGFDSEYKIKFKPYNSEKIITTSFLIDEPAPNYKVEINNKPRLSIEINNKSKTAIIKIKNFNYFPRGRENIGFFKEKIDTYMKQIKDENISKVAFDLRGNRGGNSECTNHILSYIVDKEINFYENNDLNKRRNRTIAIKPKTKDNISNANIYMLTDGRCASATAQMLAVVKHNKLATIVGEETGGTYSTHPGRGTSALKNTKLGLQIGTERESVNVPKLEFDKGIIPDKEIKLQLFDIINDDAPLLNYILKK